MLIQDKKIPIDGFTFDNTPKIVVQLDKPLPQDYSVVVLRNGEEVGVAVNTRGNEYAITDTAQLGGEYVYSAEVRRNGLPAQVSNDYAINIVQLNQAWAPSIGSDSGPYVPGTSGSKDWNGMYNDEFYIGVVGVVPEGVLVEWETEWHSGSDGWYPPATYKLAPDGSKPWRLRVQAQGSGYNYSSGVLDVTLKINGVPMGDKLTLVLNDVPYGYEGATWAVWTAPTGKYELSFTNVYGYEVPASEVRQKVTNNTEVAKQFDLYGLSNEGMEGREAFVLEVLEASGSWSMLTDGVVELYRKVNGVDTLQQTLNTADTGFEATLSDFLLNGTATSTDRFARFTLEPEGYLELVTYVPGDYWAGDINGTWTGKVNADLSDTKTLENNQGSDTPMYRSLSTAANHPNPLVVQWMDGEWSWRDANGDLMVFDTNKFITPLSGSNWSNSGSQFVLALDGMAPEANIRLRWTSTKNVFARFYGNVYDYTGTPGSLMNIYKSDGVSAPVQIAAGVKENIDYLTQLTAGQYVEFEFYATTEDRSASQLLPLLNLSNG